MLILMIRSSGIDNPIGDAGACAIANALSSSSVESLFLDGKQSLLCKEIAHLLISDCGISDVGILALADAIKSDCALTEVYLDST